MKDDLTFELVGVGSVVGLVEGISDVVDGVAQKWDQSGVVEYLVGWYPTCRWSASLITSRSSARRVSMSFWAVMFALSSAFLDLGCLSVRLC